MWLLVAAWFTVTPAGGIATTTIAAEDSLKACDAKRVEAVKVADKEVASGKYKGYMLQCVKAQPVPQRQSPKIGA